MEKATSAVWQPREDGPAGRDPDVRLAQWRQVWVRDRIPRIWSGYVFVALLCLLLGLPASTVLAAVAVLVVGAFMLMYWLRVGRTLTAVGRLLEAEPARLLDVEVLDRQVVRAGQLVLRLAGDVPTSGRLWLVGPSPEGLAAVFLEGIPRPVHAKVLPEVPRLGRPPAARPQDPQAAARRASTVASWRLGLRWAHAIAITVAIGLELAPQPAVLAWLFVIAGVLIAVFLARSVLRALPRLRLSRLLAAELVEYPASVRPDWSIAVETDLAAKVLWGPDVHASVRASGRLWIAGTPAAGVTLGVGVPDLPIAGVVRFS
ncbi:hypothetical protein [Kutzneria sp. CA-103260]|uniref:hypothetical protein n=1 Tax=Kutzneria sp. CA-103260 TaxID=2802641 RepID=UPI001BA69740|nr:hypothetical protein [Kutzneria sp. CA-103260]QUQ69873.1 hypothetical protein JJ691_76400 [Kutzneria sp. CA-103260]